MFRLAFIASMWVSACGSVTDCTDPVLAVHPRATKVESLTLTGPACAGITISSVMLSDASPPIVTHRDGFEPGAVDYYFDAHDSGECMLRFELDSGQVVEKTATFERVNDGYCSGFYYRGDNDWSLDKLAADAGAMD